MAEHKVNELAPDHDGRGLRVGVALSRFNIEVGEGLLRACLSELERLGVACEAITLATVPGALELPLALQAMAASGRFDCLVALGAVVRGDTYHFEVVSNESAAGLMRVQLDSGMPLANAVLTTDTNAQAHDRMRQKGREAAQVAVEMARLLRGFRD